MANSDGEMSTLTAFVITVWTVTGSSCEVSVEAADTVAALKSRVCEMLSMRISPESVRLLFNGR